MEQGALTPVGIREKAIEELRQLVADLFPNGHAAFNTMMLEQMNLHSEKNKGYAGGGAPLGNFSRVATIMKLYPNFPVASEMGIAIMYLLKHFDRIMWDLNTGKFPSDESLGDLAVYFTIIRCMQRV
jgi:hypothetical protein